MECLPNLKQETSDYFCTNPTLHCKKGISRAHTVMERSLKVMEFKTCIPGPGCIKQRLSVPCALVVFPVLTNPSSAELSVIPCKKILQVKGKGGEGTGGFKPPASRTL